MGEWDTSSNAVQQLRRGRESEKQTRVQSTNSVFTCAKWVKLSLTHGQAKRGENTSQLFHLNALQFVVHC